LTRAYIRITGTDGAGEADGKCVIVDDLRDALLTDFSRLTLAERYQQEGEGPQDVFARVACSYSDDADHAQRLYDYMSNLWFMPSTPILSNGGTGRGLPISCYLNAVEDSLESIAEKWNENVWLGAKGGGIGTYWGGVRSAGERVKGAGQTSGIIPFVTVQNYLTLAIAQGSLRRGAGAVYVDVWHPEIEEFLEIRKASGDFNRKSLNLHHGIGIDDHFMECVRHGSEYDLLSPKDGSVVRAVDARALWQKILETRLQTGEPYLIFLDAANGAMASHQHDLGLRVRQSNLCSEIMLHTGPDHLGADRTAVCCLASVNLETWHEWCADDLFIEDLMRMLDNVLQDFIDHAPDEMVHAKYSAMRERSVGLGAMGFHTFLQAEGVPFESAMAKSWNFRFFRLLALRTGAASRKLAIERGPCPDWLDSWDADNPGFEDRWTLHDNPQRFSHKMAVAPTASISIIAGGCSAGIEPIPANIYSHKTLSGTVAVKSPALGQVLSQHVGDLMDPEDACRWVESQWDSILEHGGSVQHLDYLTEDERLIFKTAMEIDQRWVVELAVDRTPLICQGQSVNLFLPGDVDKWDLHMLHWKAWEGGTKSLYYLRSQSVQRASHAGADEASPGESPGSAAEATDYDECLACQ
jgi:ribonucleoside-diphosphate reductase alpha chain